MEMFLTINCVLMLNWIVWNRTDYLYKNEFWYAIKPRQPTNHVTFIFQQDGTPVHYSSAVWEHFSEILPEKWISRRGPIDSPNLTQMDFSF